MTPPEGEGELGGKLEEAAGQGARPGKDPLGPLSIRLCSPSNVCTPVMQALPGSTPPLTSERPNGLILVVGGETEGLSLAGGW